MEADGSRSVRGALGSAGAALPRGARYEFRGRRDGPVAGRARTPSIPRRAEAHALATMLTTLLALAATLASPSAVPAPGDDPADVLREADRAFFRATRERGLEGWLAAFADDAIVFPPSGPLAVGATEVRRHYAGLGGFPPKGFLWEPLEAGLSAAGDFGWTLGHAGNDASGTTAWNEGRYLTVWRKAPDGGWTVVSDCGGDPRFAARLGGLGGAPATMGRESEHTFTSAAGDLVAVLGSWWASDEEGAETGGKYLSVWRKTAEGGFELAAENGFAQAQR